MACGGRQAVTYPPDRSRPRGADALVRPADAGRVDDGRSGRGVPAAGPLAGLGEPGLPAGLRPGADRGLGVLHGARPVPGPIAIRASRRHPPGVCGARRRAERDGSHVLVRSGAAARHTQAGRPPVHLSRLRVVVRRGDRCGLLLHAACGARRSPLGGLRRPDRTPNGRVGPVAGSARRRPGSGQQLFPGLRGYRLPQPGDHRHVRCADRRRLPRCRLRPSRGQPAGPPVVGGQRRVAAPGPAAVGVRGAASAVAGPARGRPGRGPGLSLGHSRRVAGGARRPLPALPAGHRDPRRRPRRASAHPAVRPWSCPAVRAAPWAAWSGAAG